MFSALTFLIFLHPQHVVFFVLRVIDWVIPDVPESLEVKIKRERYLAKQALAENHEVLFQGVTSPTPRTSSLGQSSSHTLPYLNKCGLFLKKKEVIMRTVYQQCTKINVTISLTSFDDGIFW